MAELGILVAASDASGNRLPNAMQATAIQAAKERRAIGMGADYIN